MTLLRFRYIYFIYRALVPVPCSALYSWTGVHAHCVTVCQRQGSVSVVRKWMNLAGSIQGELPCITQHEEFSAVCLNPGVLRTAVVTMVDVGQDSVTEPLTHRLASV